MKKLILTLILIVIIGSVYAQNKTSVQNNRTKSGEEDRFKKELIKKIEEDNAKGKDPRNHNVFFSNRLATTSGYIPGIKSEPWTDFSKNGKEKFYKLDAPAQKQIVQLHNNLLRQAKDERNDKFVRNVKSMMKTNFPFSQYNKKKENNYDKLIDRKTPREAAEVIAKGITEKNPNTKIEKRDLDNIAVMVENAKKDDNTKQKENELNMLKEWCAEKNLSCGCDEKDE